MTLIGGRLWKGKLVRRDEPRSLHKISWQNAQRTCIMQFMGRVYAMEKYFLENKFVFAIPFLPCSGSRGNERAENQDSLWTENWISTKFDPLNPFLVLRAKGNAWFVHRKQQHSKGRGDNLVSYFPHDVSLIFRKSTHCNSILKGINLSNWENLSTGLH